MWVAARAVGVAALALGAAMGAEPRYNAQLPLTFKSICGLGMAATGPSGACQVCVGCGVYADVTGLTACKVAACPAGSVPVFGRKATQMKSVCKQVPAGSSFVTDPETSCLTVEQCAGGAVYQDEPGQGSCKRLSCPGALPLALYASGIKSANTSLLCTAVVPKGSVHEKREGMDEVRVCAGCGAYSDVANASVCKIATAADCPAGQFPKIAFGATSAAEACAALPAGTFYDAGQCSARACNATLDVADGFGCGDVENFGFAQGVCGAADFPGLSPQDVLVKCQELKARCGVLRVSAQNVNTVRFMSTFGVPSKLEPWCKTDEPLLPQCSCPAPTPSPTYPTASTRTPTGSQAGLLGGVGSGLPTAGPSDAPAALVPGSLVALLLAAVLAL